MKKTIAVMVACCAFALCFALAGCGNARAEYVGTWELQDSTEPNLDADSIELMKNLGFDVVLTLEEDGTGELAMFGDKLALTWEAANASEGKVVIDGAESNLGLADGKLTVTDSAGSQMSFAKAEGESGESASSAAASSSEASSESAASDEAEASDSAASAQADGESSAAAA